MPVDRRGLLRGALGLSAAVMGLPQLARADGAAAESFTLEPLLAAGLDPLEVYIRIFASLTPGAQCAWWFMGALPRDVENVGPVDTMQEETVRIHCTETVTAERVEFIWKEAGVLRDIRSGEIPTARFDPVTGTSGKSLSVLGGNAPAAHIAVQKSGKGLSVDIDIKGNVASNVRIGASIAGDRVCLIHMEDKTRANPTGGMAPTNTTTFRIYASLGELRSGVPSVAATGFYGVKNRDTGKIFVNGLTFKAALDEKVNPIAWQRIRTAHPAFFRGDSLGPEWKD